MIVPDKELRIAIVSLLESAGFVIRDTFSRPDDAYPRIIIAGISSLQDGSKSQFMYRTQLNIRITDKALKVGNSNVCDDVVNGILAVLWPFPNGPYPVTNGFEIWGVDLNSTETNNYQRKDYFYIEKNINLTIKTEKI